MDTQTNQTEIPPTPEVASSCRKRVKDESAPFYVNLKDQIDEFVHASMDEHKTCFKNTMNKMFGWPKVVDAEKKIEAMEVETHAPLQVEVETHSPPLQVAATK